MRLKLLLITKIESVNFLKKVIPAKSVVGTIAAPPSKAHTLRAIIIASLASGKSVLKNGLIAEDQEFAISVMQQLGAKINYNKISCAIEIDGVDGKPLAPAKPLFIGNSGLTARFLVSIAGLVEGSEVIIDGSERMRTGRPIQDLLDALLPLGVQAISVNKNGCPPISVKAHSIKGGETSLAGDKSSQYFSSILIASPYAKSDVTIKTIGNLSSKPYLDVTIESMKEFGVSATNNNYQSFFVKSGQSYKARTISIEGDYSNAAYFFAAAAILGGSVTVTNLSGKSKQGDKFFLDAIRRMGCTVTWSKGNVIVKGGSLSGVGEIDMNNYPDIVMPLAVVAAFAQGKTRITNVAHLKFKESDRLSATVGELKKLGVNASCDDDSITIIGAARGKGLKGALVESHNDHRIAMSMYVAGLKIGNVTIEGEEAVNKSFPDFYEQIEKVVVR